MCKISKKGKYGWLISLTLGILFLGVLFQGLILNSTAVSAAAPKFQIGSKIVVSSPVSYVNVRPLPTTDSVKLGKQLQSSKGVVVAGPIAANGLIWWKINYGSGVDGWSAEKYLAPEFPAVLGIKINAGSTKFQAGSNVYVTAQSLYVRSTPNIYSTILGTQRQHSKGVVINGPKTNNGVIWWQVNFDTGADGWSSERYLELIPQITASASVATITPTTTATTTPPVATSTPTTVATTTPPVATSTPTTVATTTPPVATSTPTTTATTTPPVATSTPTTTATTTPPVATTTPTTTATTTPPVATSTPTTLQWGGFVGDGTNSLSSFETLVGKPVNIEATFIGWGDSFPTALATQLKTAGKTILIFWEQYGTTLDSISAGNSDAYIKNFAATAKASGATVILAPLHEMNGNWDPWDGPVGSNTPTKVINTWRHIHDSFVGIDNVKFAWDVNNESVPNTAANAISVYYPGDAYVDYVGVDGFNFDTQTWDQVFPSSLISQLASYNKPLYIFSTACIAGTSKAQWIKDMGAGIKKYPSILGWVWFNQNGADGNWIVNSDRASLAAFKSILP